MDAGRNPHVKYAYLPLEDWERFYQLHDTEQFREKRLKGREYAKKNLNPARLGSIGYRGHIDKWDKEGEDTESLSIIHTIQDPRAKRFLLARRKRDKDGQLRLPNQLENLAEQLIEKDTQLSQGLLQVESGTDALTMVLGPEHPGRTRAMGHMVGLKEGMPHITGKKRKPQKKADVSEEIARQMREVRAVMQAEFDHKLEVFKEEMAHKQQGVPAESPGMRKSSVGSTQNLVDDDLDEIQEITSCILVLPNGKKRITCAKGVVYPKGNGEVHNVPLFKGNVKMQVDKVEQKYHDYKLPVPSLELQTLQDAVNNFIQWPRRALILSTTQKSVGTSAQEVAATLPTQQEALSAPIKRNTENEIKLKRMKNRNTQIFKKQAIIFNPYRRLMSRSDPTEWFDAIIEPSVFGKEGHEFTLDPVDIVDMLAGSWVDITLVIWFARSLHQMIDARKNNSLIFNAETIRSCQCLKYKEEVVLYLTETMQWQPYKRFYLAPYWQGDHWTLFIILRHTRTGFILDSMKNGKNPYNYHITKHIETAVRTVMKDTRETHIKWMFAECNQQAVGSVAIISCGGFMNLCFMDSFVYWIRFLRRTLVPLTKRIWMLLLEFGLTHLCRFSLASDRY